MSLVAKTAAVRMALALAAALFAFLCSAQIAGAATFNVNSTADADDATNNNGICETATGNGVCTVRAAFEEANTFAGNDTINIPAGQYVLTLGQLPLSQNATINGAGAAVTIIKGLDTGRIIAIPPAGGVTATVAGVTISHGFDTDFGGGIRNGSGNTLTVANSIITANASFSDGGGIKNDGTLTVKGSTISSNNVNALASTGGGISTAGPVTITDSTISSNNANGGNSSGGGIYSNGDMTITNSTISSNKAPGASAFGGGIFTNNPLTLTNATIASNMSGNAGGGVFSNGVTYKNTVVANNSGPGFPNCKHNAAVVADHSLESANTCGFTSAGNQNSKDPLLGPLADNGGPTQTHALLAGSPAIDTGTNSGCPATDQRGVSRPYPPGGTCDIGAYEFAPAPAIAAPAPDKTSPVGSALVFSPARFVPDTGKLSSVSRRKGKQRHKGSTVSHKLSEGATVVFTVQRKLKGHKKGKKCSTKRHKGKRCTTYKAIKGSFSRAGKAGANSFHFTGFMNGKKLKRGSYRMSGVPTDAANNRGAVFSGSFKILKR